MFCAPSVGVPRNAGFCGTNAAALLRGRSSRRPWSDRPCGRKPQGARPLTKQRADGTSRVATKAQATDETQKQQDPEFTPTFYTESLIQAAPPCESPTSHLREQLRDHVRPSCTSCHLNASFSYLLPPYTAMRLSDQPRSLRRGIVKGIRRLQMHWLTSERSKNVRAGLTFLRCHSLTMASYRWLGGGMGRIWKFETRLRNSKLISQFLLRQVTNFQFPISPSVFS